MWIVRRLRTEFVKIALTLLMLALLGGTILYGNTSLFSFTPVATSSRSISARKHVRDLLVIQPIQYDIIKTSQPENKNVSLGPPLSKPQGCAESHCTEFLQASEKFSMRECLHQVQKKKTNAPELYYFQSDTLEENDCNFMDGRGRHPVALISTEGSGNTWVRGLLEQAAGICTGFIYCDVVMRIKGFIGENIWSGSVIVVKTHSSTPRWVDHQLKIDLHRHDPYYGAAIFILRNPYDSLVAEWNRRGTIKFFKHLPHNEPHTNVVPKKYWGQGVPELNTFIRKYMNDWRSRIVHWVLESGDHPVHVVRYEDLKRDVAKEVGKILRFLKIPFNEQELPQRLKSDFTLFKRRHDNDSDFKHYSKNQTQYIQSVLLDTIRLAQEKNKTHQLKLEEYLPS